MRFMRSGELSRHPKETIARNSLIEQLQKRCDRFLSGAY